MNKTIRTLTILFTLMVLLLGGPAPAAQSPLPRDGGRSAPVAEPMPTAEPAVGEIDVRPAPLLAQAGLPTAPGDECWADGFDFPGVDWGEVYALTADGAGNLYVGGSFAVTTGGVTLYNIARWDGAQWHPLGSGNALSPRVRALAIATDGSLYAGGWFDTADGVTVNGIARWDGTEWHPLGSGLGDDGGAPIGLALAIGPDGSLYAGGGFSEAGGVSAHNIARWDGAQWHALGSGMSWDSDTSRGSVGALAIGPDGSLYAGGKFTEAGGLPTGGIARWDGAVWHPLGSGIPGGPGPGVAALAFGPDGSLYAGGEFFGAGGVSATRIARWDGAGWHPLDSGLHGGWMAPVHALAIGPDGSLYAGGEFTLAGGVSANRIARWDGASWHALGGGLGHDSPERAMALAIGPDGNLYAGGWFSWAGGVAVRSIARWDGVSWHPLGVLGHGMSDSVNALAIGPDGSLYAGGFFNHAGGVTVNGIARWDGAQWHALGSGMSWDSDTSLGSVGALAIGPDGSLYAGGFFNHAGGVSANGIARWDGAAWHGLGNGVTRTCAWGECGTVRALAFGPDGSLYAGGHFTESGGVTVNGIARWDGAQWHTLGGGMNGPVDALAFGPDGSLYAGGEFTESGGVTVNGIARWDGAQWHTLGGGVNWDYSNNPGRVYALTVGADGSLYAGGSFNHAGGVSVNGIARWDGAQWHALGSGMSRPVYALAFGPDGSLYAGGDFVAAGGVTVNGIARWDGAQWHTLGSGMNGPVSALAIGPDGSLYAGGGFFAAGGKRSVGIARWTCGPPLVTMPLTSGWNLVSIPLAPLSTSIGAVLWSIRGHYDLVYAYDLSDPAKPWRSYNPAAPPFLNDLTEVEGDMGLWIRATSSVTLTVAGNLTAPAGIPIIVGWNLVGYPALEARPVAEALASIDGQYDLVYAYDAGDLVNPWRTHNTAAPPFLNDLTHLQTGWGYWIRAMEDCVWVLPPE